VVGKRKKQAVLFDVGNVFDLELDPQSFYAQLALAGPELFPEAAFDDLYSPTCGRPSVPPAQMALLVLLQTYERLSDQEAIDHSAFDLRWAAVLRRAAGTRLCARTTLLLFRARLALHDASERLFDQALRHAKARGLLPAGALRVILDTKPVVGRGAVEDTLNLLDRVMGRLIRGLAGATGLASSAWAAARNLGAYVRADGTSLKGQAALDWSDTRARRAFMTQVVTDARRLLTEWEPLAPTLPEPVRETLQADADLLRQILAQDVAETTPSGGKPQAELREGTAKDRRPSATDPDQRHGHKSHSRKFTGHKARVAIEPESELILDVEVLAGNAGDATAALAQVKAVEKRTEQIVRETIGDCAFGGGATRQEFADAARELRARMPGAPAGWQLAKQKFTLIFTGEVVTGVQCPTGRSTTEWKSGGKGSRIFHFGNCCKRCPLRSICVAKPGQSRTIQIHPQEYLRHQAREYQQSDVGKRTFRERVKVEHALARLARYGIGQARYFGREKTRAQLLLAAAVTNLRRTWNWLAGKRAAACGDGRDPAQTRRCALWPPGERFTIGRWKYVPPVSKLTKVRFQRAESFRRFCGSPS
jgi:hypothetical protein